jgi:hypothetical protein
MTLAQVSWAATSADVQNAVNLRGRAAGAPCRKFTQGGPKSPLQGGFRGVLTTCRGGTCVRARNCAALRVRWKPTRNPSEMVEKVVEKGAARPGMRRGEGERGHLCD